MKDDAPILHPDLRTGGTARKSDKQTNVANQVRFARGDLEAGFAAAEVIAEREFNTAMVHQGYIEPHNAGRAIQSRRT
jgi:CO/xanthine dehydrogenase Mo-binding subunit